MPIRGTLVRLEKQEVHTTFQFDNLKGREEKEKELL